MKVFTENTFYYSVRNPILNIYIIRHTINLQEKKLAARASIIHSQQHTLTTAPLIREYKEINEGDPHLCHNVTPQISQTSIVNYNGSNLISGVGGLLCLGAWFLNY